MLPEGWKEERLGDLCEKISDGIHTTPNYDENSDVFFVNGNNIQTDGLNFFENTKKVSQRDYEKYKKDIGSNTILMSINGTIGNTCLYNNERVVLGKSACYLNIKKSIDLIFILHSLRSSHLQNYFLSELTGTTIRNLSLKTIKSSNILLPPLPEQKKIAAILSTWDRAIEGTEELLANSQQQKKALMQQLLTGKKRLPGFTGEWKHGSLKSCCTCLDNKRVPLNSDERQEMSGDIPYWGANGVVDYINKYIFNETIVLIAEDGGYFSEYRNRPIAQISYGKSWVNNHAHILTAKSNICIDEWVYYCLVHKDITAFVNGGTRAKLNKEHMLQIKIPLPDIKEQRELVSVLSTADEEITALESDLSRLRQEKKALMQQLLTGKRRVTVD